MSTKLAAAGGVRVVFLLVVLVHCCCCWRMVTSLWIPIRSDHHQQQHHQQQQHSIRRREQRLFLSDWKPQGDDNPWWSSSYGNDDDENDLLSKQQRKQNGKDKDDEEEEEDWQELIARKQDGSFWSSFESTPSSSSTTITSSSSSLQQPTTTNDMVNNNNNNDKQQEEEETEAWLDTLASLTAQEIEFNMKEADRADKVRQMEEWGFDAAIIASTLGVATDTKLEDMDDDDDDDKNNTTTTTTSTAAGMKLYRQLAYRRHEYDDVDLTNVESHAMVERDPDTHEPVRSQMVYVDEHTCIGCTHCAMTAQSTFFMHHEHGRARVFQQWGDDDETIQIAIETCPVDCIHYVPYDELVQLEIERRNQNINYKARLVSQAESGGMTALSHRVGGAGGPNAFTPPQRISGNMKPRCSNCPTRGCSNCPMYGIGKNPEFQRKEQERKDKMARRRLQEQRERESKRVDL